MVCICLQKNNCFPCEVTCDVRLYFEKDNCRVVMLTVIRTEAKCGNWNVPIKLHLYCNNLYGGEFHYYKVSTVWLYAGEFQFAVVDGEIMNGFVRTEKSSNWFLLNHNVKFPFECFQQYCAKSVNIRLSLHIRRFQ